ncbi:hypothetical protein PVAND_011043 [Polypedilum vanderplanki]|uniref:Odorant binding protein n=1 Tax=Polypedilum vanderplanki TaxID=319348 RepID=A0A9J6CIT0_POLVA|nr:hypothetical protein PVAND_011043 [Polypedilum vanderplanki]
MKDKLVLWIFATFILCCMAITREQLQRMTKAAYKCKDIVNATDTDLSLLILKKPLTSREGKCLVGCIMIEVDILSDDNGKYSLNEDGWMKFVAETAKNDAEIIKKMQEITDGCKYLNDINQPDECELAMMAIGCQKEGMTKNNIKLELGI